MHKPRLWGRRYPGAAHPGGRARSGITLEWCILGSYRQRSEVTTIADAITPLDVGRVAPCPDCNSVPGRDCLDCHSTGQPHPTHLPTCGTRPGATSTAPTTTTGTACRFGFVATGGEPASTVGAAKCFPPVSTDVMPPSNLKRIFEPKSVVRVWSKHE